MLSSIQKKSLELIKQYVKDTPQHEVQTLINKYANLNIEGPTFAEYLSELSNSNFINYSANSTNTANSTNIDRPVCFTAPPDKIKITSIIADPTFCGVSFFNTFVL